MTRNSDDADVSFRTPHGEMLTISEGELAVGCRVEPVTWWLDEYSSGGLAVREKAAKLAQDHGYTDVELAWVLGRLEAHYDQGDFTLEPPTPDCFIVSMGEEGEWGWERGTSDWYTARSEPRALVTFEGAERPTYLDNGGLDVVDEVRGVIDQEIGLDRITPPEPDHAEGRIDGGPAWTTDPDAKSRKGDVWLRFESESARAEWIDGNGRKAGKPVVYVSPHPDKLKTQQNGDQATVLLRVSEEDDEPDVPAGYWRDLGIDPDQTWEHSGRTYKLKDEYPKVPGRQEGPCLGWSPSRDWIVKPGGYLTGPPQEPVNEHPTLGKKRPILEPAP